MAVATVYGPDPKWGAERKAGTVTFDGSAGWHQALQEFVDLNNAGCLEPGMASTQSAAGDANFVQGETLMAATTASQKGTIDQLGPQFQYSFRPWPSATSASTTHALITFGGGFAVNAHSQRREPGGSADVRRLRRATQAGRALRRADRGITQYDFMKNHMPAYMSSFEPASRAGSTRSIRR